MADVAELRRHANVFRRGGGLTPPSDVVLSWPAPNYVNPDTHGDAGPILVIIFLALSIITYLARMWARVALSKNAGLDDWIMTAAMVPLIGAAIAVILGQWLSPFHSKDQIGLPLAACRTYGFQWHAWDQTSATLISTRKVSLRQ